MINFIINSFNGIYALEKTTRRIFSIFLHINPPDVITISVKRLTSACCSLSIACWSLGRCLVLDKHLGQAIVKQVPSICQLRDICLSIACPVLCAAWQVIVKPIDRQHQTDCLTAMVVGQIKIS